MISTSTAQRQQGQGSSSRGRSCAVVKRRRGGVCWGGAAVRAWGLTDEVCALLRLLQASKHHLGACIERGRAGGAGHRVRPARMQGGTMDGMGSSMMQAPGRVG